MVLFLYLLPVNLLVLLILLFFQIFKAHYFFLEQQDFILKENCIKLSLFGCFNDWLVVHFSWVA
jgi:hypothetical protein